MTNSPVRIAAIGAGQWATRHHLPAIAQHPDAELIGLHDLDPQRAKAASIRFDAPVVALERLLDRAMTDIAVISTPPSSHAQLVRTALAAGVHVLVEKPFTIDPQDALDLAALARNNHLHLIIGHTYQFSAAAAALKQVIQNGDLGELVLINAFFASMVEAFYRGTPQDYDTVAGFGADIYPAPGSYNDPAQSGGGQAQIQMSHDAAMVSWLTGLSWETVNAFLSRRGLPVDLVDAVSFTMQTGCIGTFASTGNLRAGDPPQHELRIFGTKGFAHLDMDGGSLSVHRTGQSPIEMPTGSYTPYPTRAPVATIIDLASGVTADNPSPAGAAARAVAFIDAVYRSATQHTPITIDSP